MYISVRFGSDIQMQDIETETLTFASLRLRESHIEEFIRQNVHVILDDEETLLIVGQQVRNSRRGISDLTAVDGDGSIVLIEIKRDVTDIAARREPFEFQAIRYAAAYAKIEEPEELVDLVYSKYVEKYSAEHEVGQLTAAEMARRRLNEFLQQNDAVRTFNNRQRIILIASEFDDQTLSAVAWLIGSGVDIRCLVITPIRVGQQHFLNIEKILPPESIESYYISLADQNASVPGRTTLKHTIGGRQTLPRMSKLFEWGIVQPGDQLKIKHLDNTTGVAKSSTKIEVNGREMSYNAWGQAATGWSSINIYEWALHVEKGKTLDELRQAKMNEMAMKMNEMAAAEADSL